jgi:hypothetical protein
VSIGSNPVVASLKVLNFQDFFCCQNFEYEKKYPKAKDIDIVFETTYNLFQVYKKEVKECTN